MPRLQLMMWRLASRLRSFPGRGNRGATAVIFALAALPMTMIVGLAVDYSFYIQARSQANLAADAAAMHAVRAASQAYNAGETNVSSIQQAGDASGQQWFAAQLRLLSTAAVSPIVNVTYTPSPSTFSAIVTYSGAVPTFFGSLFHFGNWPISGSATAIVSDAYVEVLMLLDNSSSMLIGATTSDIVALERATPCSTQGVNESQAMSAYSWIYPSPYGYGSTNVAPPNASVGACDTGYTGNLLACAYGAAFPNISASNTAICTNGGGSPGTVNKVSYQNVPNAPCAFACHNMANNNDYYGLARSLTPPIQLRLDVVQTAAASVVQSLQTAQQAPGQFSVGVYQFNLTLQQLYPTSGAGEAGTDLSTALTLVQNVKNTPNLSPNGGNTDFPAIATTLAGLVTASGTGMTPAAPRKNLFIVTDGMQDSASRVQGPMTSAVNEQLCSLFWAKGFNVYVLYTPYTPLPNPFYLTDDKAYAEPASGSPILLALQACARYPANFFQASDPAAIQAAMQTMLATALNLPARVSK